MECPLAHAPWMVDLNEREVNCDTYDTFQKVFLDHRQLSMPKEDRLHYLLAFKPVLSVISPFCVHNRNSCTFTLGEESLYTYSHIHSRRGS